MAGDFTPDQKRYLEGFVSGLRRRAARTRAVGGGTRPSRSAPTRSMSKAQDRPSPRAASSTIRRNSSATSIRSTPMPRLVRQARSNEPPKPADNFRWRYYGLFYVAPAQTSYMCRLRIPNGILKHWQFAGLADLAEQFGGRYAHVTTRANLQIREIEPKNADQRDRGDPGPRPVLARLGRRQHPQRHRHADRRHRSAGAARHAAARARVALSHPQRPRAVRPAAQVQCRVRRRRQHCRCWKTPTTSASRPSRCWTGTASSRASSFRLALGGITGHRDFARDTGVILKPEEATPVADAIVRVFIEHGDRTNRNKARLKYVLDAWGFEKFLAAVEEKLGRKLRARAGGSGRAAAGLRPLAHIGVHPQKQAGLELDRRRAAVGRLTAEQMRGLAKLAHDFGDGDIRLTVWQNLLISGVADDECRDCRGRIEALGLATTAIADPRRPRRLHRRHRLPLRRRRTPRKMPTRSPPGARRASRSTRRSTFISPAAIIPARSITSATSA